jgi:hypothetical protein
VGGQSINTHQPCSRCSSVSGFGSAEIDRRSHPLGQRRLSLPDTPAAPHRKTGYRGVQIQGTRSGSSANQVCNSTVAASKFCDRVQQISSDFWARPQTWCRCGDSESLKGTAPTTLKGIAPRSLKGKAPWFVWGYPEATIPINWPPTELIYTYYYTTSRHNKRTFP